jgi:23S rRNA pseudouridine955/2504/2580 synthase
MLVNEQQFSQVQQVTVTDANAGQRVDNFLFSVLRGVPKSRLYRIIRKGEVRINKKRVDVSYRLIEGDIVRIPPVRVAPNEEKEIVAPTQKLTKSLENAVLYEDDHLIVINKPSGMAVHGGSGISLGLIEALRMMRPKADFLELVHRLDRDTSGCVMIAKKRQMLLHLHNCLKTGEIEKRYFAIVRGRWQGGKCVEAPLHKFVLKSGERMVKVDPEGKFAKTQYEVLEFHAHATLLNVIPVTGRTHQIRVHCAFMGHPILGDQKYGEQAGIQAKTIKTPRLFLHAHNLVIKLPYSPYELTINCAMPTDFEYFWNNLKN